MELRHHAKKQNDSKKPQPKKFSKKPPMIENTLRFDPAITAIASLAAGSIILLNTCDADANKEKIMIKTPGKECSLDAGEYALQKYNSVHFGDDFVQSDLPERMEENTFWKIEMVDNGYKPGIEKTRITESEFKHLKKGAKKIFDGPVDIHNAELVYMDPGAVQSVVCQPEKPREITDMHMPSLVVGALAAAAIVSVFTIIAGRIYYHWQEYKEKSIESENHSKKQK